MNIENPKYNPICKICINLFVIQMLDGSRTKVKRHGEERRVRCTGFYNEYKTSVADFIKRKI